MNLGIFSINDTIYFRANTVNKQGSALDATAGPTYSVFADDGATAIDTGTMAKVGATEGFYEGSIALPTLSYAPGQHFILLEATVDGQTPKAQLTFQAVRAEQSVEDTFQEIYTIGDIVPSIGDGSESIDHNFGGADNYRVTSNGTPVADVEIRAFVKSDYDAGRKSNRYVVGQTRTLTDGRWVTVIRLDPSAYTLEFSKVGAYRTTTADLTVTAVMSMSVSSFGGVQMEEEVAIKDIPVILSGASTNNVFLDHNYGKKDNLRLVVGGKPIKGVDIKVYRKTDYDSGLISEDHVLQRTVSRADGRWEKRLQVPIGATYVLHISKKGAFKTLTKIIKWQ